MNNPEIYLTWIRPTANTIHLWNYFWAIKPLYDYAIKNNNLDNTYIFIADLHWIIWKEKDFDLKENILAQYAIYKAIWFKNIFLQSDILEVTQIEKYFSTFINLWKLNRLHSMKEATKNTEIWKIKLDLFTYPTLMAADIVGLWTNKVFLGKDQKQHLEVTKEIVKKINNKLKINLIMPEWVFFEQDNEVIWLDWRKMSKSYNNYIDPFSSEKKLLKQVNLIKTDNVPLGQPKNFENCNIIKIYKLFNTGENLAVLKEKYDKWCIWYGESKRELYDQILAHFKDIRKKQKDIIEEWYDKARKEMLKVSKEVRIKYNEPLMEIKSKII